MKIARLSLAQGPRFAVLANNNYHVIADDPLYGGIEPTGQIVAESEARLVAPMIPRSKVVVVEFVDGKPVLHIKPNTAVAGPDVPITEPDWSAGLTVRAGLAAIISRPCKDVPLERVPDVVFGYTLANDATEVSRPAAQAKGFDTSCPLGPLMNTELAVENVQINLYRSGELSVSAAVADLPMAPDTAISFVSKAFSLLPGDVVVLPVGEAVPVVDGDEILVTAEPFGELRNLVAGVQR